MTFSAAVDAILDVTAGLEAAAAAGILHRDVKPSNCFVDEQGRVKIGDFGISISALTTSGQGLATGHRIVGTPGYASPSELRGHGVDARSDIYGVGATLYQLVTGRPPFDKPDLMSLLMAVANENALAPYRLDRTIPRGLSQIIVRCLSKKPERRFASHADLASALQRYSSSGPPGAAPGRRIVAALIDYLILFAGFLWILGHSGLRHRLGPRPRDPHRRWIGLASAVFRGVGRRVGSLRRQGVCRNPRRDSRGSAGRLRTSGVSKRRVRVFIRPGLPDRPRSSAGRPSALPSAVLGFLFRLEVRLGLAFTMLFCTARRGNRFAGIHDLVTGTRVVESASANRLVTAPAVVTVGAPSRIARVGPYDVVAPSVDGMPPGWSLGVDPVLTRPVWIRSATGDVPDVSPARRALNRPTRLRWLAGRRDGTDAWDAYSGMPGLPLLETCRTPRPWAEVRWWLLSLAQECLAASRESTLPPRRLERVRVVAGGLAYLVDDPPHDAADVALDTEPTLDDQRVPVACCGDRTGPLAARTGMAGRAVGRPTPR